MASAASVVSLAAAVVVTVVATVLFQLGGLGPMATVLAGAIGAGVGLLLARRDMRRTGARLVRLREAIGSIGIRDDVPTLLHHKRDDLADVERVVSATVNRVAGTLRDLTIEQDRLQAILRGMVEGVVVTDLDGRIVLTNQRARELLALSDDVVARRPPLVDVARAPGFAELMRELRGGAPVVSRDVQLQGSGEPTVQMNAARLDTDDETAFGYVVVLHDVTELRRLEVVRRDFVANVSHELRTPLTVISGFLESLDDRSDPDPEVERSLSLMREQAARMATIIDDLLTLSRLELDGEARDTTPVSVHELLESIVADARRVSGERQHVLELHSDPDLLVRGSDSELRSAFSNLVLNAVRHTPGRTHIHIEWRADGDSARFAILDDGPGIPARHIPRLTERFYRVDESRSRDTGGTGLGLAIVKHALERHDADLAIESEVGKGTSFSCVFPPEMVITRADARGECLAG